jgi:hypothetical protein
LETEFEKEKKNTAEMLAHAQRGDWKIISTELRCFGKTHADR